MAYEIELANSVHPTDAVASFMGPAFVQADMTLPLIRTENFPDNTGTVLFPISGKVEAQIVSESGNYSYDADSEITDTSVSVTFQKSVQAQKITVEALRFSGGAISLQRASEEAAKAHARRQAADLKALFSGISGSVTAASTLIKDNLLDARYTVVSGVKDAISPKLAGWFSYKQLNDLAKELTDTTATAFTAQVNLGVIGISQGRQPKGELFDILLWETDGLPTSGGDTVGCVWDPAHAFCGGVDGNTGFDSNLRFIGSQGVAWELVTWMFYKFAEYRDAAASRVLSDS